MKNFTTLTALVDAEKIGDDDVLLFVKERVHQVEYAVSYLVATRKMPVMVVMTAFFPGQKFDDELEVLNFFKEQKMEMVVFVSMMKVVWDQKSAESLLTRFFSFCSENGMNVSFADVREAVKMIFPDAANQVGLMVHS